MGAANSSFQDGKLSKGEMERIKRRFEKQVGKAGKMTLHDFEQIPELSGRPHIEQIFRFADQDNDGLISALDIIALMESLGQIYSEDEKVKVAFDMYDKDGDNLLSLEELKRLLQPDANGAPDLQTEMAAASLLEEYGREQDGHLTYYEFRQLAANASGKAVPFMA